MNKNKNKRINEFKLGDRIGKSGMHFVKRNVEYAEKIGSKEVYVNAACPFCGRVKEYRLDLLRNGTITSCSCHLGKHGHTRCVPQRREDSYGNVQYDKGYSMNFGWVYDGEAGLDTYGNRMVNVHSKWVAEDKTVMPLKELDPVENADGLMLYSRWAQSYVEANNVDLNKFVLNEEKESDDVAAFFAKNPNGRCPVLLENGQILYARGIDEYWIKNVLSKDKETVRKLRGTAYVIENDVVRNKNNVIMDCDATYADMKTVDTIDGKLIEIYEEYDGKRNHPVKRLSKRDFNVGFKCAENNKGLFRISTQLKEFVERDTDAVLKIRKYAIERIQQNILHNYNVGRNEKPTIIRVTRQLGIEEAIIQDGQIVWCQIAKVSDFLRIHC